MHNPIRSESEVFRAVVIVALGAAAVVVLAVVVEPSAGAILAAGLLGLGAGLFARNARGTEPEEVEIPSSEDEVHRVLVVANQTVAGTELITEICERCAPRAHEVRVVAPALVGSQLQHLASDTDEARSEAHERVEASLRELRAAGVQAEGSVGDEDPLVAIRDALADFAADEVVISTLPPERSRWLERGVVDRAREVVPLPVTHVVSGGEQAVEPA